MSERRPRVVWIKDLIRCLLYIKSIMDYWIRNKRRESRLDYGLDYDLKLFSLSFESNVVYLQAKL